MSPLGLRWPLFPATLLGCVAPGTHERQALLTTPPCCNSVTSLPYTPVAFDTEQEVAIDQGTPAFRFASGVSRFHAISLPVHADRTLRFNITIRGKTSITSSTYCPRLMLLSSTFETLEDIDLPIRYTLPNAWTTPFYVGQTALPAQATYLVIYSPRGAQVDSVPMLRYEPLTRRYEPGWLRCSSNGRFRLLLTPVADSAG
jgi:hypothetical protein